MRDHHHKPDTTRCGCGGCTIPATAGKAIAFAVAPAVVAGVSGGYGGITVEVVARGVGNEGQRRLVLVEVVEMKVLVASAGGDAGWGGSGCCLAAGVW
nr:hypothetical protein [Tanacetum cinerariifolium]